MKKHKSRERPVRKNRQSTTGKLQKRLLYGRAASTIRAMSKPLNLLISSAGRRVELIQCFQAAAKRQGRDLRVHGCDLDAAMSSACQKADHAFDVPRGESPDFVPAMLEAVEKYGIELIIPTNDVELTAYAEHKAEFAKRGAQINISTPDSVRIARDKLLTADHLSQEVGS